MAGHRVGSWAMGVAALALLAPASAAAQTLGTFRWQLQPYCNVVTVTVVQDGGQYHLDGTDDQCGATRKASVVGLGFPNPDGTIGFGLTIVTTPGGAPVHVDARISVVTISGPWNDNAGGSGTLAFTSGAGTGGSPRPAPTAAVPSAIRLLSDGGLLAGGAPDTGSIPASGLGTRMMWYPGKAAFRAGRVTIPAWDDVSIGPHSTAFGQDTTASGDRSMAIGERTTASGRSSTAMGSGTRATGPSSTAMGDSTTASGLDSTAMGLATTASGDLSTAIGNNTVAAGSASFAGGQFTEATGHYSFAYGYDSTAGGATSVALGRSAFTIPAAFGSFVFADSSSITPFGSLGPNGFNVRAAGGVQFFTNSTATLGATLAPNATAWSVLSDQRTKENFRALASEDLLAKLAAMPVREWNYIAQGPAIRHIGPTAQDFHAAFGLGEDPLRISTLDADGVALAAIQALEARTRVLQDENADLREALTELRRELDAVKARGGVR